MTEAAWGSHEPFDIDNGELDGIEPHQIFVLGYEMAQVHRHLDDREPFSRTVNALNSARIVSALAFRNVTEYSLKWADDDPGEMWMYLEVSSYPDEGQQSL